jgi:hypothetical protein
LSIHNIAFGGVRIVVKSLKGLSNHFMRWDWVANGVAFR